MSLFLRIVPVIILIFVLIFAINLSEGEHADINAFFDHEDRYDLRISLVDADYHLPLEEVSVLLLDKDQHLVDVENSNQQGMLVFRDLADHKYTIKILGYRFYQGLEYDLDVDKTMEVELSLTPNKYVTTKEVENQVMIDEVILPMHILYQKPSLPNGCEVTALAASIQSLGFDISKEALSDEFLPMTPVSYSGNQRFADDPNKYFIGNPRSYSGWYAYEQPLIATGNAYFKSVDSQMEVIQIDDMSMKRLEELLYHGKALVIWVTLDYTSPNPYIGWYLPDGSYYQAISNSHTVVVYGFNDDHFYIMNPLEGYQAVHKETLMKVIDEMGNRGIYITTFE